MWSTLSLPVAARGLGLGVAPVVQVDCLPVFLELLPDLRLPSLLGPVELPVLETELQPTATILYLAQSLQSEAAKVEKQTPPLDTGETPVPLEALEAREAQDQQETQLLVAPGYLVREMPVADVLELRQQIDTALAAAVVLEL
jgi:hypothetical protein